MIFVVKANIEKQHKKRLGSLPKSFSNGISCLYATKSIIIPSIVTKIPRAI